MPEGFVATTRVVNPFPHTYASYTTLYGPPGSTTTTAGPSINVAPYVDSAVVPGSTLKYGSPPKGKRITLGRGVHAVVSSSRGTVSVYWRFPSSGVPKYLRGVASVTVTGSHLPVSTVVAVARSVRPD
ncbi:MAG TPA: hypothetical protein VHB02_16740 [Acidimicrobiales bacterium]|nr:hypothetical protein [Acidimicrobiales bacterium]